MKYCEIRFNDYSGICIKAERTPTKEEAYEFLKTDCDRGGYKLSDIEEVLDIDDCEAHSCFDMENEESFPIFK